MRDVSVMVYAETVSVTVFVGPVSVTVCAGLVSVRAVRALFWKRSVRELFRVATGLVSVRSLRDLFYWCAGTVSETVSTCFGEVSPGGICFNSLCGGCFGDSLRHLFQ